MSEESKQSRRRRRRPRSRPSAKNRSKNSSKAEESKSASSGGRRGRSRRRNSSVSKKTKKQEPRAPQESLTVQKHTEKAISPINKEIFIYTYTLRPRSLLDDYKAGPNVAERMEFEQPDKKQLKG